LENSKDTLLKLKLVQQAYSPLAGDTNWLETPWPSSEI